MCIINLKTLTLPNVSCKFTLYKCPQLDRTPLHWACAKGHLPVVEILVDHGADVEAKDKVGIQRLKEILFKMIMKRMELNPVLKCWVDT